MSGSGGGGTVRDGRDIRAGDDGADAEEIRRGEGGYDGGAEGGVREAGGEVRRMVEVLERRIGQLEEELKATKKELERKTKVNEGYKYELVNVKQMTPSVL